MQYSKQYHTPRIHAVCRLRQQDHKFQASLSSIVKLCLQSKTIFFKEYYLAFRKEENSETDYNISEP